MAGSGIRADAFRTLLRAGKSLLLGRPMSRSQRTSGDGDEPFVPGALAADARLGLSALDPAGGPGMVLVSFPTVTNNPIQSLLLRTARTHGIAPIPMASLRQLEELTELPRTGIPTILHLHWLDRVIRGAASEAEANARATAFLARLDAFLAAGGRLVWTVHNVLPHGAAFEAEEARLAGEVASRAEVIHVMAGRTAERVAPWYSLPAERILHVPHPNYDGVYPDYISGIDARFALGIDRDELVFLMPGAIQRYKGLDELLDAWAGVPRESRRLVVAGIAASDPEVVRTIERARADPQVVLRTRKLFHQEMQIPLRAADVAVFPYHDALNSGALLLALTFGVPVIVPANSGLADLVEPSFGITYGGPGGPSLTEALAHAGSLASEAARDAARRAAAPFPPAVVSEQFVTGLRRRLDSAVPFRAPVRHHPG